MNKNLKTLAKYIGKIRFDDAEKLGITAEEYAALIAVQQKINGEYTDTVEDTERQMLGGSDFTRQHAALIIGQLNLGQRIHAVKSLRQYSRMNGLRDCKLIMEHIDKLLKSPNISWTSVSDLLVAIANDPGGVDKIPKS